jgi:hypothetical protein
MIQPITLEQAVQSLEKDFKKIHDEHFVSVDEILKPQPVAISIGYAEYKGTNFPISMGSYGDFSCIVGASKAKKSFLKSMLIAGFIGGDSNLYFNNIKGHRTTDKFVIDIDTEQSEYHSQRVFKRVVELVGVNPNFYKPFSLRKLSANERLEFIDWLFNESMYKGNIGLVSIDGVADLVNDVNDLEASNKVAQKLLEWSANENCHIITVLHRNFGTKKPTGHLGSAVLKKAETVIFVEKEGDMTIVNPEYTRNQPFEPFAFEVGNDWLPRLVDYQKSDKPINNKSKPSF